MTLFLQSHLPVVTPAPEGVFISPHKRRSVANLVPSDVKEGEAPVRVVPESRNNWAEGPVEDENSSIVLVTTSVKLARGIRRLIFVNI